MRSWFAIAALTLSVQSGCNFETIDHKVCLALDVGHSEQTVGATSARGEPEYEFNARLAREIATHLRHSGFACTELINENGNFDGDNGLTSRTDIANGGKFDLFISVHHDSVQASFFEPWYYQGKTLQRANAFSGFSVIYSEDNPQSQDSLRFAKLLGRALMNEGLHPTDYHALDIPGERRRLVDRDLGVYDIEFLVLKATQIPAVLLEAGFIINSEEEVLLNDPEYQHKIAQAVGQAVSAFFKPAT